jgi:hypothetical protein
MPSRSWSFASQSSTVTPSPRMYTRRQEAHRRYLTRHGLQDLLERLFPNHPNLDFHIRVRLTSLEMAQQAANRRSDSWKKVRSGLSMPLVR